MGRKLILWPFALLLVGATLQAETAKERFDDLLATRLDPQQCFRVRDVFLEREELKLYLTDGHVIFAEPYRGRDIAALFVKTDPNDTAEILVIPPTTRERQSVARYTGETVLNERFTNAMMLFTDNTAELLRASIARSEQSDSDPETGERLAKRWTPVMKNLLEGVSLRALTDIVVDAPVEHGFFAAALGGGRLGRFDAVVDPRLPQSVALGQTVYRNQRRFYETWTQFDGRSFREGKRESQSSGATLENYSIETTLRPDLSMEVVAEADLVTQTAGQQAFVMQLSKNLRVTELLIDSEPADYLQRGQATGSNRLGQATVFLVLPEAANPGDRFRLKFRYEGTVISRAGNDVYLVESRASWYPRAEPSFSHFEMRFNWPSQLDLAATGTLVESGEGDGIRSAVYRTENPILLAGFNLGRYVSATRQVEGYEIKALANRRVETKLEPKPLPPVILMPQQQRSPRRRRRSSLGPPLPVVVPRTPPVILQPADRVEAVADESADAFRFFLDKFGPPLTSHVTISPIPGQFGQGFPGLVYASTLSYFRSNDGPLRGKSQEEKVFYSELLRPHEISHQWWGNTVAATHAADTWLLEALATYSSLLYLEHTNDREALDRELRRHRDQLLRKNESGETIESAGPVVLDDRLRSAKFPGAYRAVVYGKGAWIIHMLRGILGDDAFFALLRGLLDHSSGHTVTTDDFQKKVAEVAPPGYGNENLKNFFAQWVYGVGIPTLSVDYEQRKVSGGHELLISLSQAGVPEHFATRVPIEITLESGAVVRRYEYTDGGRTEIPISLESKATRVEIDPEDILLAVKR